MSGSIVSKILCLALATSVIATVNVDTADAKRRTLLEQWFQKVQDRKRERRYQKELLLRQSQAKPIKKVPKTTYYTYKTEAMTTLSLAGLLPEMVPAAPPVSNMLLGEDDLGVASDESVDLSKTGSVETPATGLTRQMVEGWSFKTEAKIAKAVKAHYKNDQKFLWLKDDFSANEKADAVLGVFERAEDFGLAKEDYLISKPDVAGLEPLEAEKVAAKFEVMLTAAALRYSADAQSGRINPNKISGYHDFPAYKRDYSALMKALAGSDNPAELIESYHPDNSRFAELVTALAELRSKIDENPLEPVPAGTFVKPGQENSELSKVIALIKVKASPDLIAKHQAVFDQYQGETVYSEPLVELVKEFQKEKKLGADGIIGKKTLAKLAISSPKAKMAKIELAMERLRWLPEKFGQRYVFINQPAYRANYMVNDKVQLGMRAIVGKPANQTSFFYDTIELVEVNPYWNVPRSILVNEMLGKIRSDPGYLEARNYEVVSHGGGQQNPYNVDWYSDDGIKKVYIRQKPGSRNALGELKILFPNKHSIYMHDTPSRNLFSRSKRALSHGCIRLQKPRDMAAAVLQTSVSNVSSAVEAGQNQTLKVKNKLPVYISYFTAWPDDNGKIHYYTDIYGRDRALNKAIKATSAMRKNTLISAS